MAKPRDLVVRFLADTRDFLRGGDSVERAYRDMAREADHTADKGEDSARRLARAYERAGDRVKAENKQVSKNTREAYATAGDEAGSEFAQNLGEAVSSGDISGLLSGTVGGLVGTFGAGGPIGLALGGLAAVGVGVFGAMSKAAEEAASAAQTAFDQLHEATTREAKLNAVLEERFGGTLKGWEQIQRYSDASGVSVEAIASALANGGPEARQMADHFDAIMRKAYETTGQLDASQSILIDGEDDLRDRADAMDRAARAAQTEKEALAVSEGILRRSAAYYAARGSAYAPGGSTYNSQVPRYAGGRRA